MCVKQIHADPEILSMVERLQLSLGENTEIMANDFVMSSTSSFCSSMVSRATTKLSFCIVDVRGSSPLRKNVWGRFLSS